MTWIGVFLAVSIILSGLSQGMGGNLADRFGRKPVMMFGILTRTALVFAIAFAVKIEASFSTLAALHLASAFLGALFEPACSAWVADLFEPNERVRAFSITRTGGNLGWAIGPALGAFAAGRNYAGMFFWTGVVYSLSAILVLFWIREGKERRSSPGKSFMGGLGALRDPRFRRLCLGGFLIGIVMSNLVVPLSLYSVRFAGLMEWQVGLLFSLNGGLVVLLQVGMIQWLRREKLTTLLTAGAFLYAVGYGGVGFAGGFAAVAASVAMITLGEILVSPSLHALAANLARPDDRGSAIGLAGMASFLGHAFAPLAGGWGLEICGHLKPCPYWFGVAALAVAAAAAFFSLKPMLQAKEEGTVLEPEAMGEMKASAG